MRGLFDCMVQLSTPVCRYQKHVVCVTIYLMCCFNYSGFFFKHRIQHIQIVVTMKSVLPQHLYQSAQQLLLWPEPNLSNKSFPLG